MAMFTLIAHKEESWDSYRQETYSADFKVLVTDNEAEVVAAWAKLERVNRKVERNESEYDIVLLINGIPQQGRYNEDLIVQAGPGFEDAQWDLETSFERIEAAVKAEVVALENRAAEEARERAAAAEAARAENARIAAQRQEAEDRATYERLAKRFGEGA